MRPFRVCLASYAQATLAIRRTLAGISRLDTARTRSERQVPPMLTKSYEEFH